MQAPTVFTTTAFTLKKIDYLLSFFLSITKTNLALHVVECFAAKYIYCFSVNSIGDINCPLKLSVQNIHNYYYKRILIKDLNMLRIICLNRFLIALLICCGCGYRSCL